MPRAIQLFSFLVIIYLASAFPGVCDEPADDKPNADEPKASATDLEIIEVVLLDLIDNKEFRPLTDHDGKKAQIVLVDETAGSSGLLSDNQLDHLKWFIREDIRADLRERNPKTPISLADFVPTSDKILVEDLKGLDIPTAVHVVEKATLDYRTAEVTVDPRKHCLNAGQPSTAGQGALRIDLERGTTYKVSAAGDAWMTAQTGNDADPFPGILFYYGTDEEDGYAIRYTVLKPGDSITFKTPWLIAPDDEVFALAFFISAWPQTEQHGNCRLTFTRATEEDKFDDSRAAVSDSERPRLKFLGR